MKEQLKRQREIGELGEKILHDRQRIVFPDFKKGEPPPAASILFDYLRYHFINLPDCEIAKVVLPHLDWQQFKDWKISPPQLGPKKEIRRVLEPLAPADKPSIWDGLLVEVEVCGFSPGLTFEEIGQRAEEVILLMPDERRQDFLSRVEALGNSYIPKMAAERQKMLGQVALV